jgi:hypothetical protein
MASMSGIKVTSNGFSAKTMITLVLVSLVSLLGLALLSAYEPELKSGNDGATHALSKSSVGYAGMVQLLVNLGEATLLSRKEVGDDQERATLVIAPTLNTDPDQIADISHFGPLVVLLPKWSAASSQERRGWSEIVGRVPTRDALRLLPEEWLGPDGQTTLTQSDGAQRIVFSYRSFVKDVAVQLGQSQPIKSLRVISGENWITVLAGPTGGAIIAKHKSKNIYVVADPDLFNNAGLSNLANARLLRHFLDDIREEDPIIFDLTLNGFQRQPNLARVAIEPPVLGATLCMALAGILVGLQAAVRFLPPATGVRAVALGKRALADNTAGLIRMGRREHRMALPFAQLVKRQVAKAISAPANLDPVALTATLDRVSEMSKSQLRFSHLEAQAGAASTSQDLIKVAKDLYLWKQETTRERQ